MMDYNADLPTQHLPWFYGWSIAVPCAFICQVISVIVSRFLTPKCVHNVSKGAWRWKNIVVSLFHSSFTGIMSVACFYHDPRLASDILTYYNTYAYYLTCASIGYFMNDVIDLMRFDRSRQSYELLLHHIIILLCFGVTITQHRYVAYCVVALTIEINSIFLHIRQLMQISKIPKTNHFYRFIGLLNLATYLIARIGVLAWMTRWIMVNRNHIPFVLYIIGTTGLTVMIIICIVLLVRLLQSDFITKKQLKKHCE